MMNQDRNEQLSAVFDGEELPDEALYALLKNDDEWQARWQRYHVARMAMRGELPETLVPDVCARVSAAIAEDDVVVFAPKKRRHSLAAHKWGKQAAGMAIAATIATVAVLSVQTTGRVDDAAERQQVAQAPVVAPAARAGIHNVKGQLSAGVQRRLSGYIVNHNEFSSRAGMQSIPAYTRIVATTPGERVANDQ